MLMNGLDVRRRRGGSHRGGVRPDAVDLLSVDGRLSDTPPGARGGEGGSVIEGETLFVSRIIKWIYSQCTCVLFPDITVENDHSNHTIPVIVHAIVSMMGCRNGHCVVVVALAQTDQSYAEDVACGRG